MRTVLPRATAQTLHQDVSPAVTAGPLVGFGFMVDAFSGENGATRFVPGSEALESMPADWLFLQHPAEERACGRRAR
jgi:ectoine hydroxylase-related dioxygenase (phytanoyl-CoA dioxygenase family)